MSLGCGCGSYTPINRIINATVCQNYFIIIDVACASPTNISTPGYGTAVSAVGQIIYTHTDELYTSETDSFTFKCNGVTYTVNLVIEQTIPPTTTITTFSATGTCEVGNATYTWNIPDCATLVEGYTIHDQTIELIVPMYDPENPTAVCLITVDVCCDYCHNCCKCETIEWYPPNCTLECGEVPSCNCNHLPCHIYNPLTGNCEPTCESDEVCCTIEGNGIELSMTCSISGKNTYLFDISSDTYDIDNQWVLASINDAVQTTACITVPIQTWLSITGSLVVSSDSGEYTFEYINPTSLSITFTSDGVPGNGIFFIGQRNPDCNVLYAFQLTPSAEYDIDDCTTMFLFNNYYLTGNSINGDHYPICNDCTYDSSFCAECCDTDNCYIAGCPNTNMICYNNACYCILNDGSYIPAPTDGTCCPNCTNDTVPECYECIDGTVVPPDDCPIGQVYDWDTCTCTGTPCSEFNCLNPESPTYCPEIPNCGCLDIPNSSIDVCVPCNSVSCTANIDCPLGCYCLDGTCTGNPCFEFDCVNTNPNVYCPTQDEGCFCDDTECLPCNSVSCTGDIDCPFGCICDENAQTCTGNPCVTAESECDAYFLHHENDLVLTKTCVGNSYYLITPTLGLEPGFVPTNNNTTWWINFSNYVNGWWELTAGDNYTLVIEGVTAVQVIGGKLRIYHAANIDYVSIKCLINGRKIWYRLNAVNEDYVDCEHATLDIGGAFLCGEIFTVESNSGIEWSVNEWFVSPSSGVSYSSTGPDGVLVIECAGTELITLSAEVSSNICTISTCPTAYQCNCTGSRDCDTGSINFHSNFNQGTGIWKVVADVLYDGVTGFAWYDCNIPNPLPTPTAYTCEQCGANPYLSQSPVTPLGDDGTSTEQPNCFNPEANNNCNCVCGWTYYGAELLSYNGAQIEVLVTDPINAKICFQTDIEGNDVSGNPCCVNDCIPLEFEVECNLSINAIIDCFLVGSYIVSFDITGSAPGSSIINVIVNGNSVDFTQYDNTVTFIHTANPNTIVNIVITDSYGCTASTMITTPCCDITYNIEEITCFERFSTECQSCGQGGNDIVIGYNFTFYGIPLPYQIYMHTNDAGINAIFPPEGLTVNSYTYSVEQQILNCSGLVIDELWVNSQGCQTYIVSSGQFCEDDNCYHGLWKHVGSNIAMWNNPNSIGYINYVFTGLQVGDNQPVLFQSFGLNPIDLKAIICQAHKNAGTSSCNQNTYTTLNCAETISTGTTCYMNNPPGPPNCIDDNFPSHNLKNYHNNIVTLLYEAWQCRLQNNMFLNTINGYLVAAGYPGTFGILKLIIPSNPNPNVTLPDNTYPEQLSVYQYYIITNQRYETGFIKPVRNTNTEMVPPKPLMILGCQPGDCFEIEQGYNCGNCSLLVDNGQYATSAECLLYCTTAIPCETSEYGYDCGTCTSLSYGGTYSTIEDCNANCESCVTATFTYNCNTSGFTYYIETPPLDNMIDSYSANIPVSGITVIDILPDRIIIDGVTTLQNNASGNVIVSGTMITQPWTWTYPAMFNNPLMLIEIINNMTDCINKTDYYIVPMICDYPNAPLNGNISFSCVLDEIGGVYLASISATGGFPAYYFKLEYVVNGISYYQQSYTDMLWWNGEEIQLNVGNIVPDLLVLTITDFNNNCITMEYTPNCLYECNENYYAPTGQLLVDILMDFSESTATDSISELSVDTGYDIVSKIHFDAIRDLFDYYIVNSSYLGYNKLSFRLFIYGGPGIYQCVNNGGYSMVCPTSFTHLNSAFLNSGLSFGPAASNAGLVNLKTIINNTTFCFTDVSGNFIIDGEDTILCAIQKSFSTMTNYNKMAIVLTDVRTSGPDRAECNASGNCTTLTWNGFSPSTNYLAVGLLASHNKVDIIHTGLYPYHKIAYRGFIADGYPYSYLFPINRYWVKYGINKVHIMNRTPEDIAEFMRYLINYRMSGNQLPCYTVDAMLAEGYSTCDEACDPPVQIGYNCGHCQHAVVNGEYATSIECEEVCQSQQCGWIATSSCGMVNGNRLITITINASNQILSNILPITITIGGCTNSQFVVLTENDFVNGIYTHQFICLGVNVINIIITDDDNCIYTNDIPTCDSQVDNLCDFVDGSGDIILIPDEGSPNRHIYVPDWIDGDIPNLIN